MSLQQDIEAMVVVMGNADITSLEADALERVCRVAKKAVAVCKMLNEAWINRPAGANVGWLIDAERGAREVTALAETES